MPPLNKALVFQGPKCWWLNSFLNSFLTWFLLEAKSASTTPWTKYFVSIDLREPPKQRILKFAIVGFWRKPFLKPSLKPSSLTQDPLRWKLEHPSLFWNSLELEQSKKAQLVNFLTRPFFKNAENQSRKGGGTEAPQHLNNHEWCLPPLNKALVFQGPKCWWLNSFLNSFLIWFLLEAKGVSTNPWTKYFISIDLGPPLNRILWNLLSLVFGGNPFSNLLWNPQAWLKTLWMLGQLSLYWKVVELKNPRRLKWSISLPSPSSKMLKINRAKGVALKLPNISIIMNDFLPPPK